MPKPTRKSSFRPHLPLRSPCLVLLSAVLYSCLPSTAGTTFDIVHDAPNRYYTGCLHQKVPGWTKLRTCARHDPPEVIGVACEPPNFDTYLEIRIATGNWDSTTTLGWLTQIILSELLGIPSSMESNSFGSSRDFYDRDGRIDYDRSNSAEPLANAAELKDADCRSILNLLLEEEYVPCAHFYPEFWGYPTPYVESQSVEPPETIGVLGSESWFVTKFTAEQDPTLVSYHGLQGEQNRHKLAATFKRPFTWQQYCEQVSPSNCTTPDEVAQRPPQDEEEAARMFLEGEYTGHFRYTDKNNCTLNPTTCTGHIANYPCGWKSFMEANIYHLNIGLDPHNGANNTPGGYTTDQLIEMWHAANATQENLMMMWWTPEPLYQKFVNTPAEMQRVMLKPYTMECEIGRNFSNHEMSQECAEDLYLRVGDPEGACENPTEPLRKLISAGLHDALANPDIPEAARSPAYDVLRRFQLSEPQLGELFDLWESEPSPRDAACTWAANNLVHLNSTVPFSYPRVAQESGESIFGWVALVFGCISTIIVALTGWMVHQNQLKPPLQYAQLDFLYIVLAGSLFVSIGSILAGLPAADGTCLASVWFVYIGYTLELVAMIVKVAAINTMMDAARTMRRVTLDRGQLYRAVAFISLCVGVYMAVWSGLDPPRLVTEFSLTDDRTDKGERIVGKTYYCGGDAIAWQYVAVGWNLILLVGASVLAFQTRNTIKMFNESRTLAFLIYSHFFFVILRVCTFLLADNVLGSVLGNTRSVLYAADSILTCGIYFLPKLTASDQINSFDSNRRSSVHIRFDPMPFSSSNNHASSDMLKKSSEPRSNELGQIPEGTDRTANRQVQPLESCKESASARPGNSDCSAATGANTSQNNEKDIEG